METVKLGDGSERCLSNSIRSCPSLCNCSENEVDCRSLNLTTVPRKMPKATLTLKLSFNQLSHVGNETLSCQSQIQGLYFDNNKIGDIDSGAFHKMTNLKVLSLRGNCLVTLDTRLFKELFHLRVLDLSHNLLTSVHLQLLTFTYHLHSLDLRANQLKAIPEGSFDQLTRLETLFLAQNPLGRLPDRLFSRLLALHELSLSQIGIVSVQQVLFRNLHQLQSLDLSSNQLETLNHKVFRHLQNLRHFDFSRNPLNCDCKLRPLQDWVLHHIHLNWTNDTAPRCATPEELSRQILYQVLPADLTCPKEEPKEARPRPVDNGHRQPGYPEPLPYDPMMGWYTAATLSGMLLLFLIFIVLDNLKRKFFKWRRAKLKERDRSRKYDLELKNSFRDIRQNSAEVPDSLSAVGRQLSREETRYEHELSKRNDLFKQPVLPKVEIHLAPNLHEFTSLKSTPEYTRPQDILIEVCDTTDKNDANSLLWPSQTTVTLGKLQQRMETSL